MPFQRLALFFSLVTIGLLLPTFASGVVADRTEKVDKQNKKKPSKQTKQQTKVSSSGKAKSQDKTRTSKVTSKASSKSTTRTQDRQTSGRNKQTSKSESSKPSTKASSKRASGTTETVTATTVASTLIDTAKLADTVSNVSQTSTEQLSRQQSLEVSNRLASDLLSRKADNLQKWIGPAGLEMKISGQRNRYAAKQAQQAFGIFLNTYQPASITWVHRGVSSKGLGYGIAKMLCSVTGANQEQRKAQVSVFMVFESQRSEPRLLSLSLSE